MRTIKDVVRAPAVVCRECGATFIANEHSFIGELKEGEIISICEKCFDEEMLPEDDGEKEQEESERRGYSNAGEDYFDGHGGHYKEGIDTSNW